MFYSIVEITSQIGAHRFGNAEARIGWLLTDSRSLIFPETTLFFAIQSERNDGHKYIPQLYQRGVRNFAVSKLPTDLSAFPNANFLLVPDSKVALQRLAERHREEFNLPTIGVTGSNGKTIVKEWIYQLLSSFSIVTRSPRSYNSQIGVPLSIWLIDEHSQLGVFEAGISEPGEMEALRAIIQPTIGIMTNIGEAHQENFVSMEQKCLEKLKLFKDSDVIIYCADDVLISHCLQQVQYPATLMGWSLTDAHAPLFVSDITPQESATKITYTYKGTETSTIQIPFIDKASIENAITSLCTSLYILEQKLGLTNQKADLQTNRALLNAQFEKLEPVAMRLEVKEGINNCTLINDSYNSDLKSLEIALDFMKRRQNKQGYTFTLVLSDMLQTGLVPKEHYSSIADLVNQYAIDKVVGVGNEIGKFINKFEMESLYFETTEDLIASGIIDQAQDEVILLKGASIFHFEKISDLMSLKVHETTLEVNLNALVDNYNHYRSFLKPETKMVCMVKASAYGAGSIEVAKTLQDHQVDYLAVAVADEGVDLRRAGITSSIIIMNPEMTSFKDLFDYDLEPEVYNFRLLDALIHAAEKEGITNFPIHIKLDTGMSRLGFNPENDIDALIKRLKSQSSVIPRSVFSHFAGSDSEDFNTFTEEQFARFDKGSLKLQAAFDDKIIRHICNTAGIERFPQYHLDMVRLGLGLYGIDPFNNHMLNNVSTLRTTILQIRELSKESTVGYSRRGELKRDSRIAAIPIGYADGLNRHLGRGNGFCLVNGLKAYYVGNICMDVCMIDVTDIPCQEGDTAIIFGNELPVTTLSDILDTIPYEVLTNVSTRVKRVYFQD